MNKFTVPLDEAASMLYDLIVQGNELDALREALTDALQREALYVALLMRYMIANAEQRQTIVELDPPKMISLDAPLNIVSGNLKFAQDGD